MISLFTSSPTSGLDRIPLKRQTGGSESVATVRKFPSIQDDFLDDSEQQGLEKWLETTTARILSLQTNIGFYNQRLQKRDPKRVELWGPSYQKDFEEHEAASRELIQSVPGLESEVEKRKGLIEQRLKDMRFLRVLAQEELIGNTSTVGWDSTIPKWKTRYGVHYRMEQIQKSLLQKPTEPLKIGEVPSGSSESRIRLIAKKEQEDESGEDIFAKLQDLVGVAAKLKEHVLVYQHALTKESHTEVARSAYLLMQDQQGSLQKKMETLEENIQKTKELLNNSLVTERLLNTPDVPVLEERLRRLEIWQGQLKQRFDEITSGLSSIQSMFKWTEEQLKAPVIVELSALSESEVLGDIVLLKEELELAGKDKSTPSKEQREQWVKRNLSLKQEVEAMGEERQKSVRVVSDQEKVLGGWLESIEDLRQQMQQAAEKLSQSIKERQEWQKLLPSLKPIPPKSEGSTPQKITLLPLESSPPDFTTEEVEVRGRSQDLEKITQDRSHDEVVDVRGRLPDLEKISRDRPDYKESKKKSKVRRG